MLNEVCENIKTAVIHGRTDIIRSILDVCEQKTGIGDVTKERLLNSKVIPEGTFLLLATQLNQGDVVRNLLLSGADPNVADAFAAVQNPNIKQIYVEELLRATAGSEISRVQQMLDAGVDINSLDSPVSQNTALHWAACFGTKDIVCFLIARGANVNAVNTLGATPLHDAVNRGDKEVCAELVRSGADIYQMPHKGSLSTSLEENKAEVGPEVAEGEPRDSGSEADGCEGRAPDRRLQEGLDGLRRKRSYQRLKSDEESRPLIPQYQKAQSFDDGVAKSSDWSDGVPVNIDWSEASSHRRRHISESAADLKSGSRGGSLVLSSHASSLDLVPKIEQMMENLNVSQGKSAVKPLVTNASLHLLWPQPQNILELSGPGFSPQKQLFISVAQGSVSIHRVLDVWEMSRPALLALGYVVKIGDVQQSISKYSTSPIECVVNASLFTQEDAYQIHISANKIHMSAGSVRGLHYSILTLTQLLKLSLDCPIPAVVIRDHSSLHHRGVLLDLSPRGRIPTLDYLLALLDVFSSLKINHVHLYTRLLPSCDWQLCYSKSELVAVDRRAQDRFMTLVPVLDVDDSVTTALLDSMWPVFQELLTCFPSLTYVHLGPRLTCLVTANKDPAGEADDTGSCCSHSGTHGGGDAGLHRLGLPPAATVMLCANSLHDVNLAKNPLPKNVVLLEYGFQADYDFREWSRNLRQQGGIMGFCPGTAAWNSVSGCPEAAVCNIYRAVETCVAENGLGVVTAHWSGSHHLTPHPFATPGFLLTAGLAWNPTAHLDYIHCSMGELLDAHILQDSAGITGGVILELGYLETYVSRSIRNQSSADCSDLPDREGSSLYKLLSDCDNIAMEHCSQDVLMKVAKHIKKCQKDLLKAKLNCAYGEMVLQEVMLSADLMLTACRIGRALLSIGVNPNSNMGLAAINLGVSNLPPTFRTDIANKLLAHIEQYKGTWLQRHLPAGLQTSLLILTSALHRFVPAQDCASPYS